MAELELSVFSRECLARRISDEATLQREVQALETERNQACATINWQFTTHDTRHKLSQFYPSIST